MSRPRDRGASRRCWARRSGARRASRSPRPGPPRRRCDSWRGRRSPRSAGTATASPRSAASSPASAQSRSGPGLPPAAVILDQPVGGLGPPGPGLIRQDPRWLLEQRAADPPGLLGVALAPEARAAAEHRRMEQDLIGGGPVPALLCELHVEIDLLGIGGVAALAVDQQRDARGRVQPDDELVGLGAVPVAGAVAEPRGFLEDQPELPLLHREQLPRPDEEGDAAPPPVVDLEAHRRERLGGRVLRDALDLPIALVLPA